MTKTGRKTLWLFLALSTYIIAQFTWWAVLLLRRNAELTHLRALHGAAQGVEASPVGGRLMVVSEAAVFLLLLLVLLWFTYRAVWRDLTQAARQRNLMLAITHELRTPIAAAKLQLQTLQRPQLSGEQREALLGTATQELDRLATLTNKVLQAAGAEDGIPLTREQVDVAELAQGVVAIARETYGAAHEIRIAGPPSLIVQSDAQALRSILENLLENAAKYAPAGTVIDVKLEPGHHGWRLLVCDEGPGIPANERERIFERFYRMGQEETREQGGTGLGLYIVKRLTQRCGGAVEVRPRQPRGSIFAAAFPNA